MPTDERWPASQARFARRIEVLPEVAAEALASPTPAPPFDPLRVRRILVTGLGSSEAHARLLVACLQDELGMQAGFLPTGALRTGPPPDAGSDALVVFSQGLSPNSRFALQQPGAWGAFGLATAVPEDHADPARRALLGRVADADGWLVRFPPADEYGTLVRVAGPLAGCIAAIRMAAALGRAAGCETQALRATHEHVLSAVGAARAAVDRALAERPRARLDAPVGFLASGRHAGLLHNLRLKWLETLLRPMPPAWELLDFAHGPFQESLGRDATWIALTRSDASGESALLEKLEAMLDPSRHALLQLHATLPGAWALVEHEAQLDHLLLRALRDLPVDLEAWPGKGADGPLYDLAPAVRPGPGEAAQKEQRTRFETLSAAEIQSRLDTRETAVVIPLGATEQHGPHLPLATDSWIADALAARLCARHPTLLRLPALALGCSSEHAGFAGTLSLEPDTLMRVLEDLVRSLSAQGFTRAFLFSAHGGNCAALSRALPELRSAALPMRVDAFTDLARLVRLQHQVAREHGVDPAAAGHHAGEFETSILLALAPQRVCTAAFASGLLHRHADAQALFYPSLRENAPDGVVGDPRLASATRANAYLEAWTELLDAAYRSPEGGDCLAESHTKGVQSA